MMNNLQEAALLKEGKLLPVMEEFYSLQGEGHNTGKAAYFLRIGGCDVGCSWCDVKESWNAELHPLVSIDKILNNVLNCPAKAVVVTGGEPLQYNLDYLCSILKDNNIQTFLETSGAYELSGKWDWICLSPKKKVPPLNEINQKANELKVIIHDKLDFEWAEENANKVTADTILLLQPEWSMRKEMMPLIVDYILKHPVWNISLQSHKYMNIP
ncbi:MAG: 7-carboxy-7-deazaguanine synthase QueE [Bacteroidales bacterium]|jgi:organic radical activating enzyme